MIPLGLAHERAERRRYRQRSKSADPKYRVAEEGGRRREPSPPKAEERQSRRRQTVGLMPRRQSKPVGDDSKQSVAGVLFGIVSAPAVLTYNWLRKFVSSPSLLETASSSGLTESAPSLDRRTPPRETDLNNSRIYEPIAPASPASPSEDTSNSYASVETLISDSNPQFDSFNSTDDTYYSLLHTSSSDDTGKPEDDIYEVISFESDASTATPPPSVGQLEVQEDTKHYEDTGSGNTRDYESIYVNEAGAISDVKVESSGPSNEKPTIPTDTVIEKIIEVQTDLQETKDSHTETKLVSALIESVEISKTDKIKEESHPCPTNIVISNEVISQTPTITSKEELSLCQTNSSFTLEVSNVKTETPAKDESLSVSDKIADVTNESIQKDKTPTQQSNVNAINNDIPEAKTVIKDELPNQQEKVAKEETCEVKSVTSGKDASSPQQISSNIIIGSETSQINTEKKSECVPSEVVSSNETSPLSSLLKEKPSSCSTKTVELPATQNQEKALGIESQENLIARGISASCPVPEEGIPVSQTTTSPLTEPEDSEDMSISQQLQTIASLIQQVEKVQDIQVEILQGHSPRSVSPAMPPTVLSTDDILSRSAKSLSADKGGQVSSIASLGQDVTSSDLTRSDERGKTQITKSLPMESAMETASPTSEAAAVMTEKQSQVTEISSTNSIHVEKSQEVSSTSLQEFSTSHQSQKSISMDSNQSSIMQNHVQSAAMETETATKAAKTLPSIPEVLANDTQSPPDNQTDVKKGLAGSVQTLVSMATEIAMAPIMSSAEPTTAAPGPKMAEEAIPMDTSAPYGSAPEVPLPSGGGEGKPTSGGEVPERATAVVQPSQAATDAMGSATQMFRVSNLSSSIQTQSSSSWTSASAESKEVFSSQTGALFSTQNISQSFQSSLASSQTNASNIPIAPPPPPAAGKQRPVSMPPLDIDLLDVIEKTTKKMATSSDGQTRESTQTNYKSVQGLSKTWDGHTINFTDKEEEERFNMLMKAFRPASDSEGEWTPTKKKKMFASSSFYDEPQHKYPTVEEQVDLCKKIAASLSDDTNRMSRGASMFMKRVKCVDKWVVEGPDPTYIETPAPQQPQYDPYEPVSPDPLHFSMMSAVAKEAIAAAASKPVPPPELTDPINLPSAPAPQMTSPNTRPQLKLVLDPRQIQDAMKLAKTGYYNEHNVVSPDICFDLVRDLNSPVGKGAQLFAKRKKRSEQWVVDENTVKEALSKPPQLPDINPAAPPVPELVRPVQPHAAPPPVFAPPPPSAIPENKLAEIADRLLHPRVKLVKSPWEAALESPYGSCDSAFEIVDLGHPTPAAPTFQPAPLFAAADRKEAQAPYILEPYVPPLPKTNFPLKKTASCSQVDMKMFAPRPYSPRPFSPAHVESVQRPFTPQPEPPAPLLMQSPSPVPQQPAQFISPTPPQPAPPQPTYAPPAPPQPIYAPPAPPQPTYTPPAPPQPTYTPPAPQQPAYTPQATYKSPAPHAYVPPPLPKTIFPPAPKGYIPPAAAQAMKTPSTPAARTGPSKVSQAGGYQQSYQSMSTKSSSSSYSGYSSQTVLGPVGLPWVKDLPPPPAPREGASASSPVTFDVCFSVKSVSSPAPTQFSAPAPVAPSQSPAFVPVPVYTPPPQPMPTAFPQMPEPAQMTSRPGIPPIRKFTPGQYYNNYNSIPKAWSGFSAKAIEGFKPVRGPKAMK